MPKAKGSPKTGGRKKGSVNLKSIEREARAKVLNSHKMTPLQILMAAAHSRIPSGRGVTIEDKRWAMSYKLDAAKAAAPYVHPKLNAVNHSGFIDGTVNATVTGNITMDVNDPSLLEAARRIAFVMAMGARAAKLQEKVVNPDE